MYFMKRGWILLFLIAVSSAFETCYENDIFGSRTLIRCPDSCCGTISSRYCCATVSGTSSRRLSAVIIGVVIAGVVALVAVITGVVLCCVCCCRSSQGHRGRVVTTNQQLAVVSPGTNLTPATYNAGYYNPNQPAPGPYYPPPAGTSQAPPPYPAGPAYGPGQAAYPAPSGEVPPSPYSAPSGELSPSPYPTHFENNPETAKTSEHY